MAHMPYPLIPVEPNRGDPWPDMASAITATVREVTADIPGLKASMTAFSSSLAATNSTIATLQNQVGAISTPPPMTADFTAVYNAAKA